MAAHEPFNYELFRQQAVQQLRTGKPNLAGIQGLLAPVIKDLLETALSPDSFAKDASNYALPDDPEEKSGIASRPLVDNSRPNRHPRKLSSNTDVDRKHLERSILELYENGNSYETIQHRIYSWHRASYEIETLIHITNQFLPQVQAWQRRPLQPVYVCLWLTNQLCQTWQENEITYKTVCNVVGVDLQGNRDILGYYIDNQSPVELWPRLLNDLKFRGVKDALIICTDNISELKEIINEVYPLTHVHGSIVHFMRNSLLHIRGKDLPKIRKDLQSVYQAPTSIRAAQIWQAVKTTWKDRYPLVIASWEQNWPDLSGLIEYPDLVRTLTHGINLVLSCQELVDNSAKVNGVNTTETEILKSLCITSRHILSKQKLGINKWGLLIQQLAAVFGERMKPV